MSVLPHDIGGPSKTHHPRSTVQSAGFSPHTPFTLQHRPHSAEHLMPPAPPQVPSVVHFVPAGCSSCFQMSHSPLWQVKSPQNSLPVPHRPSMLQQLPQRPAQTRLPWFWPQVPSVL